MTLDNQTLSISLFVIAAVYAGMGLLVWSRRPGVAITSFAWMMFSLATWSLGEGLEYASPLLSGKITAATVQTFGIASIAVYLFTFSATYTGRQSLLSPMIRAVLWVIPVITIILAWTNPYHHLIFERTWIETAIGGVEVFAAEFGAWFWLQILFSYGLLLIGIGFLVLETIRSPMPYRLRTGILLVGTAFPWIGSVIYFTEALLPKINLTLFLFLPAALVMAWGILRYQLLGVLPLAPDMVLQDMDDGVLAVDIRNRVLYLNRAAAMILRIKPEQTLGQPLAVLLPDIAKIHHQLAEGKEATIEKEYRINGENRIFDIRLSQLSTAGLDARASEKGGLIIFRDIHRLKKVEIELQNREAILGAINLAAQQFLKTTAWEPNIPAFLERLGQAVGTGRTFVFQNYYQDEGQLHTCLAYEWADAGIKSRMGDPDNPKIPVTRIGPPIWSEQLYQNKLVTATTSQLLSTENQELAERGVLSTTLVPIFVEETWWGFLGLEDYAHERTWESAELQALQAAADIVGAAEVHARNESALIGRQQTLSLQHDIVVSALQTSDLDSMAQSLVDRLVELIHADGCLVTLWNQAEKKTMPLAASGKGHEIYQSHSMLSGDNTLTSMVLKSGAHLIVEDTTDPDFRTQFPSQDFPFRSALILPMIAGQKPLGAIHLVYEDLHRFQSEEIVNSEQAAGLIALALEKFQAVEDASRRADESETIRMASASVVETLHSKETVDRILEQLLLVVPYDSASVQLIRESELEIVGGRGWDDPDAVIGLRFPIPGNNPNTIVIQTGKPHILENAGEHYGEFKEGPHSHIHSWMGVPLNVRGQIIGLLAIDSTKPDFFNAEHVKTVSTFADHVAIALENARLFEAAERNTRQQATLLLLSAELSAALTEEEVYQGMTQSLHDHLGYQHVGLLVIEEATGDRILKASIGWPDASKDWRIPVGKGVSEDPIKDGKLHYFPDVSKEPRYIPGMGGSEVDIPVWIGDKISAILSVANRQTYAFKQDDLDLLSVAANLTGLALTRGRLISTERKQYEELAVLHAMAMAISETTSEDQLLERATQIIGENLYSDNFGILMVDDTLGVLKTHASYQMQEALLNKITDGSLDKGVVGHVLKTGKTENVPDVSQCPYYLDIDSKTRSELAVPLHLGDRIIGVINAESNSLSAFSSADERLLTTLAGQLVTAIDRLRSSGLERERAAQLAHSNALIEALGQVAARIGSASDLNSVFETLGQELQNLDFICLVALFDSDHQSLRIGYTSLDNRMIRLFERMTGFGMGEYSVPAGDLSEHVDFSTQPGPTILADPVGATADLLGGLSHAMITRFYQKIRLQEDSTVGHFPLIVEAKTQGFLWLWGENLHEQDLPALSIFADQVAIAVENARLFEETQKRLREQTVLREAGTIISSALDLDTILTLLCEQLGQAIDVTSVYINSYDEENSGTVVLAEYFSPNACRAERDSDLGTTYSIQQTGKEFIAHMKTGQHDFTHIDDRDLSRFDAEHMQQYGVKSILNIPLLVKGQLIGFAELWESRRKRKFSTEEINLCLLLAQQAAIGIENARLFEEVQNLALMDTLTGLYNRRGLFEIGNIEFARALRMKRPFSVIMIDIDHFKRVNDKHGHPIGDQALQALAGHLRNVTRDIDIVGRYGGEEFTFLLSGLDLNGAQEMAERLRKNVEKNAIKTDAGNIKLTISLGVAEYNDNSPNLKTLVTRADQALYVAKHKGRNRVALGT